MFLFDLLSPKKWIESILGTVLLCAIVLIPGWKVVFTEKNFTESVSTLTRHFPSTTKKSIEISYSYYRSLFNKETKKQFEELKKETIKALEKQSQK